MKCLQMLLNSLKGKKNKEISSEIIQPKKMVFNNSLFTDQSLKEFAIFQSKSDFQHSSKKKKKIVKWLLPSIGRIFLKRKQKLCIPLQFHDFFGQYHVIFNKVSNFALSHGNCVKSCYFQRFDTHLFPICHNRTNPRKQSHFLPILVNQ